MTIYRGLNKFKTLNDIDDKKSALVNLGLNQRDLTLIAGLSRNNVPVSKNDIHFIAGLREDQAKSMFSLSGSSSYVNKLLTDLKDVAQPLEYNLNIDGQLLAGAVKFKYVNYDELHENSISSGDVSTSRVSAWSIFGEGLDATLSYGGEVAVTGNTLKVGSLATQVLPSPKTFRSEIPTHTIKIKVKSGKEGTLAEHKFIAMRGIPIVFTANFKNALLGHVIQPVTDNYNLSTDAQDGDLVNVPATWRITNDDGTGGGTYDGTSYNTGDGTPANPGDGTPANPAYLPDGEFVNDKYDLADFFFRDGTGAKSRKVEFFYAATQIDALGLAAMNLNSWPKTSISSLKGLVIAYNDFNQLPSFGEFGVPATLNSAPEVLEMSELVAANFGTQYTITDLSGTSTQQWHTAAGTQTNAALVSYHADYVVGDTFTAKAAGAGAGKVIMTALDTRLATKEISVGNFIVGEAYEIITLGNTTPEEWNTAAGTTDVTYIARDGTTTQGSIFIAETAGNTAGATDGTAIVSKHGTLELSGFAPALEEIDMSVNNLSRAIRDDGTQIVAHHQLNTLPLSLKKIQMRYTFRDSTEIDLLNYRNLTHFEYHHQLADRVPRFRAMPYVSNTHVSPKVLTKIVKYVIVGHKYSLLASGVCASPDLEELYLDYLGILGPETEIVTAGKFIEGTSYRITDLGNTTSAEWHTAAGTQSSDSSASNYHADYKQSENFTAAAAGTTALTTAGTAIVSIDISIASDKLTKFYSNRNNHGVVSMEGKADLTEYTLSNGFMQEVPAASRVINNNTFNGCDALSKIILKDSSFITGNIDAVFRNLAKLKSLDIRGTAMNANLSDDTFSADSEIESFLMSGKRYGLSSADTVGLFGTPAGTASNPTAGLQVFYNTLKLRNLTVTNNIPGAKGPLPDFIKNEFLEIIHIQNTSLSGTISITQLAASAATLQILRIMNNKFSLIDNLFANENNNFNALKKIDLKKNRINGYGITSESIKGCPALVEFNIAGNKRSAIPLGNSALYGRAALPASSGFRGQVPDFSSCPSLKKCILSGNSITNYVAGSLSNNILLEKLDIGNNDLSLNAAQVLLIDLYINYTSAKRSGVVINIAGNGFNKESLLGDSEARNSAYEVLVSAGWTLTI